MEEEGRRPRDPRTASALPDPDPARSGATEGVATVVVKTCGVIPMGALASVHRAGGSSDRRGVEDIARGSKPTATQDGRDTTVHLSGRMISEKRSSREPDGEKVNRHRLRGTRGQGDPCSFVVHKAVNN